MASGVGKVAAAAGARHEVSDAERDLLRAIFGRTLDLRKLELVEGSPLAKGASRTLENGIYFEDGLRLGEPDVRYTSDFIVLLTHESTHVWQYQNQGLGYIPDALFEQGVSVLAHGDRGKAYEYSFLPEKAFSTYDTEQQAKLVEEYVGLRLFGRKPKRAQNFDPKAESKWLTDLEAMIARDINRDFDAKSLDGLVSRLLPGAPTGK
jgi:hypothetical protein